MLTRSRDLSIHGRIVIGYLVVTLCLASIGAVGFWALTIVDAHLRSMKHSGAVNVIAIELERDVIDLQRCVQRYSSTGHKSVEDAIYKLIDRVDGKIAEVRQSGSPDDRHLVVRMQEHLDVYRQTFKLVRKERSLRRELVSVKLEAIHKQLMPLLHRSGFAEEPLHRAYSAAERGLYRYLYDPTRNLVADPLRSLDNELKQSTAITPEERSLFRDYQDTAVRIIQATRGYLYLTGVVMAGEAYEFSHVSGELKQSILQRNDRMTDGLTRSSNRVRSFTVLLTAIAVLIGLWLSYSTARSISFPLRRITETFQALASGTDATDIPGRERKDEIGLMAAAADVFRKKNKQTEKLLQETNALANDLQAKTTQLARSNEELDQFVYTVSHDLKSPVVTAIGFIGMINDLVEKGQVEEALDKLPRVERATNRMSELINDLLDLSRIGRIELEKSPIALDETLHEIADAMETRIAEHGIRLEIESGLPSIVACPSRVRQVFENLLGNALKYAKNDHGPVVRVSWRDAENETLFCVADNGKGILPEHHAKVFALFQRLETSDDGTGVGLAVVERIMTAHGGRVWIDSHGKGDGCRFWLAFPKVAAQVTTVTQETEESVDDTGWTVSV